MLQLYGFYSVGGYKDMYFGEVNAESSSVYYLPLLPIMKKRERPDEIQKIQYQEALPKIEIITKSNSCGFPSECNVLFSHGGYILIYKTLHDGRACLAIRNLYSTLKDEEGRSTPFNLLFIADSEDSTELLDSLALFCVDNSEMLNDIISPTIQYDQQVNGIRADIFKLYEWIKSCPKSSPLCHYPGEINYLMVGSLSSLKTAVSEQDLNIDTVDAVFTPNGSIVEGDLKFKPSDSHNLNTSTEITEDEIEAKEDSPIADKYETENLESIVTISSSDNDAKVEIKKIGNNETIEEVEKEPVIDMALTSPIENTLIVKEDKERCDRGDITMEDLAEMSDMESPPSENPTIQNETNDLVGHDDLEDEVLIKGSPILKEESSEDDLCDSQPITEIVVEEDKQEINILVPETPKEDKRSIESLESYPKTYNEDETKKEIDDKVLVFGYYAPQYMVKWLIVAAFGFGLIIGLII